MGGDKLETKIKDEKEKEEKEKVEREKERKEKEEREKEENKECVEGVVQESEEPIVQVKEEQIYPQDFPKFQHPWHDPKSNSFSWVKYLEHCGKNKGYRKTGKRAECFGWR